jgi:hypothetical protein
MDDTLATDERTRLVWDAVQDFWATAFPSGVLERAQEMERRWSQIISDMIKASMASMICLSVITGTAPV